MQIKTAQAYFIEKMYDWKNGNYFLPIRLNQLSPFSVAFFQFKGIGV